MKKIRLVLMMALVVLFVTPMLVSCDNEGQEIISDEVQTKTDPATGGGEDDDDEEDGN